MIQRFGTCALAARFRASRLAGRCLAILLVFLGAAVVQAQAQAPLEISPGAARTFPAQAPPQAPPQTDPGYRPALPAFTGRVVDTADMLDAATVKRLDGVLAAHEAATSDQVVVVTMSSLGNMAIEEFGYQLGRKWGVGQQGKNNGVLLIVSRDDRKLRIEVGYGLEGKLTDADAAVIINQTITPAFRRNDYAGGIEQGVAAILQRLDPPPLSDAPSDHAHPAPVIQQVQTVQQVHHISETFIGFVVVIFGGFMLVMFLVFHGNPFRRKPPKPEALILGAAAGTARKGRGKTSATRSSSASSSSSSRSSSSSSSSSSSRSSSSRGGGGSFGGGGASGGW